MIPYERAIGICMVVQGEGWSVNRDGKSGAIFLAGPVLEASALDDTDENDMVSEARVIADVVHEGRCDYCTIAHDCSPQVTVIVNRQTSEYVPVMKVQWENPVK